MENNLISSLKYQTTTKECSEFSFSTLCCPFYNQDIGNDFTYYIDIGTNNNSRTQISKAFGLPVADEPTPNILKCETAVVFWLTWENATLRVNLLAF